MPPLGLRNTHHQTGSTNEGHAKITQLQSQIEAKKEMVNKLDGAIWGIEQERQEANVNADSNAVSAVEDKAD